MCSTIRTLRADEIEIRTQQVSVEKKGAVLLLYKNARTDMDILDEVYGPMNWQREHSFKDGKNYCKVSIWDNDKQMWIVKEDVGTESNTEAEKGEASDAFKRACTNIGIGRELYTSPFIYIDLQDSEINTQKKQIKNLGLRVAKIAYNARREIVELEIVDRKKSVRFSYPSKPEAKQIQAADPIQATAPMTQTVKRQLTAEHLADALTLDQIMKWIYNAWTAQSYDPNFDIAGFVRKTRDVDDMVMHKIREHFDKYKITHKK